MAPNRAGFEGRLLPLLCVGASLVLWGCESGPPLPPRPDERSCLPSVLEDGFPVRLSETGCYEDLASQRPAPDLVPYGVASALWTDGAIKHRYLALPVGATIGFSEEGAWEWPLGAVVVKTFVLEFESGVAASRRPVETRLLARTETGWAFATYEWEADGSDTLLLDRGQTIDFVLDEGSASERTVHYAYPDRETCVACHSGGADVTLGPRTDQLNSVFDYGHTRANQLEALASIGIFDDSLPDPLTPSELPSIPDPRDTSRPLEERARAYLHANCSHCHRPGGWVPTDVGMDLRYSTPLEEAGICGVRHLYYGPDFGDDRVTPGNPDRSTLVIRMSREDIFRMPPVGVSLTDSFGLELIREWIASLDGCP